MEILPLIIILIIGLFLKKGIKQAVVLKEKSQGGKNFLKNFKVPNQGFLKGILERLAEEAARQKELYEQNNSKEIFTNKKDLNNEENRLEIHSEYRPEKQPKKINTSEQTKFDLKTIFILPLILMVLSLFISKIKIGGTIMSSLHGWPYPFFIRQIKDVVDGNLINELIFIPGSFYHYVIFNYLFYLIVVFSLYSFIRSLNKN